jgi:hypothetical protein
MNSEVLIIDSTFNTNRNEYTSVEGIGISNTFHSFNFFFCFCFSECEDDFNWIFQQVKEKTGGRYMPKVIGTDKQQSLINAIHIDVPEAKHLLCVCYIFYFLFLFFSLGHVNMNILAHIKKYIKIKEIRKT